MRIENFNNLSKSQLPEKKIPSRLWLANEAMMLSIGKIDVLGKENIKKIPPGAKVVVMTTHLTDLDVSIVIHTIGKDLDVAVMNMSIHHKMFGKEGEASTNIGMRIAGKDNFIPIDYKKDERGPGKKTAGAFDPSNFELAVKATEEGKAILIAAHNPLKEPVKNLDNVKGGYGGVYTALLADAYILPITVVLDKEVGMHGEKLKTIKEKPNASVVVGKPFKLEKIDNIEHFSEIRNKKESGRKVSEEDMVEFLKISHALREKSQEVIKRMSDQLLT